MTLLNSGIDHISRETQDALRAAYALLRQVAQRASANAGERQNDGRATDEQSER